MQDEEPTESLLCIEQRFVDRIRELREASGMTQTDLARNMKKRGLPFHQQTVQRIESGERPVRLNEAAAMLQIFDVDLDSMLDKAMSPGAELRHVTIRLDQLIQIQEHVASEIAKIQASLQKIAREVDQ